MTFILFKISIVALAYLQTCPHVTTDQANTNKKSKQENVLFDRIQLETTLNMFLS